MAEDQKNAPKGFQSFCAGMDFAEIMRKMMEAKKTGQPFNCAEMMSQVIGMCSAAHRKEEGARRSSQEE